MVVRLKESISINKRVKVGARTNERENRDSKF
jgi:hypothetical protein